MSLCPPSTAAKPQALVLSLSSLLSPPRWPHSASWLQPSPPRPGASTSLCLSSHCLQDSNPHCQTMTSCHPQPRPPPTQARPPMQPLPPTLLVVLLLLLYFCHDTHSQAGFTSKNAQHPWTSLASHPQFLKPARGKHPLISATGPGHTVGFCHVPSLASWVSCWTRLPTLSHILFYAGVLICS